MRTALWPIKPYELCQSSRFFLGMKYARAIDAALREPAALALWNHLLWRWGKRIARLRGLTAVAEAGPLAIMSGHGTESFAGEEELREALPKGLDLVYADTSSVPARAWKGLFRTGKFQFQITDPQSIEGGLPFRVFECGACGVPLLSDHRPELAALFPEESGLVTAATENGLRETAARMFRMSKSDLAGLGAKLHGTFEGQHTWEIRWRELMAGRQSRMRTTDLSNLLTNPATIENRSPQPLDPIRV
jgi:hypothetical protein